jgi:Phage tail sheath C-terminal domain
MALISPGVQVSVSDESQYTPTAAGSVAYVLLATEQDKATPSGTLATYTTKSNAGKLFNITSQRDLVQKFGNIAFKVDSANNPLHGDERNEYGLLAAYSALGVSNQIYVQRADVDLKQLTGTGIRPTGQATDGTYWLDVSTDGTNWGLYEWAVDGLTFVQQTLRVITDSTQVSGTVPISSVGAIGEYAVVATSVSNPIYYKGYTNTWTLVGSDNWKDVVPTITGSIANPANLSIGQKMRINGSNITLSGSTVSTVASDINTASITGVSARSNGSGQLEIFADGLAASSGNIQLANGQLKIEIGGTNGIGGTDCSIRLGLWDNYDSGNTKTLLGPTVSFASYRNNPAWRQTDSSPRPFGSVWLKTSATGKGASWGIKEYNANLDSWILQSAPLYAGDNAALYGLSPVAGGADLAAGTLYVRYDTLGTTTTTFRMYRKNVAGLLKITGTVAGGAATYVVSNSFTMEVSVPGSASTSSSTITLTGTTAASLVGSILKANLPNVVAAIESNGSISISHLAGGTIKFTYGVGTPLATAGIISDKQIQIVSAGSVYLASPWTPFNPTTLPYTYSTSAPYSNPTDGTLWYYNNALDVDIMINTGSKWDGYQNVSNDSRGYNLTATDNAGPILSASKPTKQSDGTTPVVPGDLWVDTGDLDNYPMIYRYNGSTWDLLDNKDQVTTDGILFADARWDLNGTTDPITADLVPISDLVNSYYIDDDCPDYRLYARGTLLFNTRRSGYNVKRFESTWFADPARFNGTVVPTVKSAWVSASGNDSNDVPYFGHKAQRNVVVEALKAAVESSTALREEQTQFNLIVCPGYPELIQNMITLNNDRKQTAFIIGDTPLSLNSSNIENYIKNTNLAVDNGANGLVSHSEYLGVYYPSGYGTDLAGESVVVPPSHMMLRTMIRSDNVSYPWFAPAGVRRGLIDNTSSIGYIDVTDNNTFKSIGVTVGLRDTLYASNVNPLTVLPGVGLVAYGQKTRASMTSAMDRINVSRLVCYLRLVLDKVARPFIFEPNDTITRNQVKSAFESVLNDLVAKRGLYDYLVVCDTSNNTPDRIDRNELYVDIAIKPVKAIEFVYIPVRIVNTGASLTIA